MSKHDYAKFLKMRLRLLRSTFLVTWVGLLFCYSFAAADGVPDWVETPLIDTDLRYYGIGSGRSADTAKQSALESIAGKLLTQLDSSYEVNTRVDHTGIAESVNSNVKSSISNISLSNYDVDKVEKQRGVYWVRVGVDKKDLYAVAKSELDDALKELANSFAKIASTSAIVFYRNQSSLSGLITHAQTKLVISATLNSNLDYREYSDRLAKYRQQLSEKMSNFIVYIDSDAALGNLKTRLASLLSEHDIRGSTKAGKAGTWVGLYLSGSYKESVQFDSKFVAAKITSTLKDEFGHTVSVKEFFTNGSSWSSHEAAKSAAENNFIQDLIDTGVLTAIGVING